MSCPPIVVPCLEDAPEMVAVVKPSSCAGENPTRNRRRYESGQVGSRRRSPARAGAFDGDRKLGCPKGKEEDLDRASLADDDHSRPMIRPMPGDDPRARNSRHTCRRLRARSSRNADPLSSESRARARRSAFSTAEMNGARLVPRHLRRSRNLLPQIRDERPPRRLIPPRTPPSAGRARREDRPSLGPAPYTSAASGKRKPNGWDRCKVFRPPPLAPRAAPHSCRRFCKQAGSCVNHSTEDAGERDILNRCDECNQAWRAPTNWSVKMRSAYSVERSDPQYDPEGPRNVFSAGRPSGSTKSSTAFFLRAGPVAHRAMHPLQRHARNPPARATISAGFRGYTAVVRSLDAAVNRRPRPPASRRIYLPSRWYEYRTMGRHIPLGEPASRNRSDRRRYGRYYHAWAHFPCMVGTARFCCSSQACISPMRNRLRRAPLDAEIAHDRSAESDDHDRTRWRDCRRRPARRVVIVGTYAL